MEYVLFVDGLPALKSEDLKVLQDEKKRLRKEFPGFIVEIFVETTSYNKLEERV